MTTEQKEKKSRYYYVKETTTRMYTSSGRYVQPYMRRNRKPSGVRKAKTYSVRPRSNMGRTLGLAAPPGPPKAEVKFVDVSQALTLVAGWTPLVGINATNILNSMQLGTGSSGRIGRDILLKSFQMRWQNAAGSPATIQRIICAIVKNPTLSLPAITYFLTNSTGDGVANLFNTDQFEILWDKYPQRDQGISAPGVDAYYKKLNHEMKYDNVAAPNSAPTQGQIFVFVFSSAGTLNVTTRARYSDL